MSLNNGIEVSVVVPVYNAAKFLETCVQSIVNQKTTWSYEAIFVNDGSTDNSLEVLEHWAKSHDNIIIVDQENAGVSSARNAGIDAAHGKYIVFVDSDDWVDESYIEDLRNSVKNDKCGIVIQGMFKEVLDKTVTRHFDSCFFDLQNFVSFFKKEKIYHNGFPFAKIFNLKVVKEHNLYFCKKVRHGEDLMFLLRYLMFCEWYAYDLHVNYHYRNTEEGTLVHSYGDFQSELTGYLEFRDALKSLQEHYHLKENDLIDIKKWLFYFVMRTVKTIYRKGKNYLPRKQRCKLLMETFSTEDLAFLETQKEYASGLDKIICTLLYSKKISLLDYILNIFFSLRNYSFANWFVKVKYGKN